jgi:hypothetical protein
LFDETPPEPARTIHCKISVVVKATLKKSQALREIQGRAGDIRLDNESYMGGILAILEQGCVRKYCY